MWRDRLSFAGQRALVTGGASGMGAACAATLIELGAAVHVLDLNEPPVAIGCYHHVDLRDEHSINTALADIGQEAVDVLFNCAGVPQTFPAKDVVACNLAGLRHLTERVITLMAPGASITSISSAAAYRWDTKAQLLNALLDTTTMSAAMDWFDHQEDAVGDAYVFSKMAINLYTLRRAPTLARQGIRMNAIAPANTLTPMTELFVQAVGQDTLDLFQSVIGYAATPQQQADVMVFLASELASYITGTVLNVDGGFVAAATTKQLRR